MQPPVAGRRDQFLIAGTAAVLTPLLQLLGAVPGTDVVSVSRSGSGELRRLVVAMDPAQARALATALGGAVIVDENVDVFPT